MARLSEHGIRLSSVRISNMLYLSLDVVLCAVLKLQTNGRRRAA